MTLVTFERNSGDFAAALTYAQELAALQHNSPQIGALIDDLRRRLGR